jgi:hypothetical protein
MANISYEAALEIIDNIKESEGMITQTSKNIRSALDGLDKTILNALTSAVQNRNHGIKVDYDFVDKDLLLGAIEKLKDTASSPNAENLNSSWAKSIGQHIGQVVLHPEHSLNTNSKYIATSPLNLIEVMSDELVTRNRRVTGKIITEAISKGEELPYRLQDNPLNIANYEAQKLLSENDNQSLVAKDSLEKLWDSPEIDPNQIFDNSKISNAVGKVGADNVTPDPWGEINTEKLMEKKISPPTNVPDMNASPLPDINATTNLKTEELGRWQNFVKNNSKIVGGAEILAGAGITYAANNERVKINAELAEKELGGEAINFGDRSKQVTLTLTTLAAPVLMLDGFSRSLTKEGIGHWAKQVAQGVKEGISR